MIKCQMRVTLRSSKTENKKVKYNDLILLQSSQKAVCWQTDHPAIGTCGFNTQGSVSQRMEESRSGKANIDTSKNIYISVGGNFDCE